MCVVVPLSLLWIGSMFAQGTVAPGSQIRVTRCTPQCAYSTGTLLGLGQDYSSVVLHFGQEIGPVEVPFDAIERMEVSLGREKNRLAGGLLGGLAAGGVTFWALKGAGSPCDADAGLFCGQSTAARISFTAAATAVGAVVGVLVAPGKERWEVISPNQLNPGGQVGWGAVSALGVAVRF